MVLDDRRPGGIGKYFADLLTLEFASNPFVGNNTLPNQLMAIYGKHRLSQ